MNHNTNNVYQAKAQKGININNKTVHTTFTYNNH